MQKDCYVLVEEIYLDSLETSIINIYDALINL